MSSGRYAAVAVPVPVRRLFTYRVEATDVQAIGRGSRVRVPLGPRRVVGTIVEWPTPAPEAGVTVRSIEAVLSDQRQPTDEVLELTRFVADYYLCSWGEAIEAALPPDPGRQRRQRVARRLPEAQASSLPARASAQRRTLALLPDDGSAVPLATLDAAARRALPALRRAGLVELLDVEPDAVAAEGSARLTPEPGPTPTAAQRDVLQEIDQGLDGGGFAPFLLFGATGSGKTEVYVRAARRALDAGRSVLYLVPEIGLTPLLVSKIERRFPGELAVLHSGLSARQRYETWRKVREGKLRLVLGTRSAVFAPLADVGLIIVDEEQDSSYKQGETPRYNARDLALVRARSAGALVLLGSATPSMESFRHARAGRYGLLRLGARIQDRPLPSVTLVDMREEFRKTGEVAPLSGELARRLAQCLERGEQALVLRNRRGWSAALLCPTCGKRVTCDRCSIAMTWHRVDRRIRCHYCGLEHGFPQACPTCGSSELKLHGEGTEQIEDLIRDALPGARVERMDRDTVRKRGEQERILRAFDQGQIDILVGTQMIAKGHDFPRVTLVGVLSADQALGMPDFRSGERVFQLLTQVAGRAGRGERPGEVVVQAFEADHPLLAQAASQDYEAFYDREIRYRSALRYPPVSALVQLLLQHAEEHRVRQWAELLGQALRDESAGRLLISGPGPAPIERLRGRFRYQILVRTAGRRRLIAAVERAVSAVEGQVPRNALTIDVDPYTLT